MARTFSRTITTPAAARMVRPSPRPVVSLLTDFGARDPSAGIMRAVVLGIAPDALVIDISHEVDKFHVRDAALLLWCSVPYLPGGAHVAVVDPGVGTERRAIAIETLRGDFLVGPDNGILLPAASRLGGITRAHQLTSAQYRLPVISSSFHGRDLFAPAAAHLSLGLPLEFLGPGLDPRGLVHLDWPEPQVFSGVLRAQVIYLDTFGNVKLSALGPDLQAALGYLQPGERLWLRMTDPAGSNDVEVTWADTFGRVGVGQPLLTEDSYGRLSVAINQGSAVQAIGIREDAEVLITRQKLPSVDDGRVDPGVGEAPAVPMWTGAPEPGSWSSAPDPTAWSAAPGAGPWQANPEQRPTDGGAWAPGVEGWTPGPDAGDPGAGRWGTDAAGAETQAPIESAADPWASAGPEAQPPTGTTEADPWASAGWASTEPWSVPPGGPSSGSSSNGTSSDHVPAPAPADEATLAPEPRSSRRWRR